MKRKTKKLPAPLTPNMRLILIAAVAENGVIGRDNELPWRLQSDLKFFRRVTQNNIVIMGRKTYESLGRALTDRGNIVVTRNKDFTAPDAVVVNDLEYALELCRGEFQNVFIIGGADLFNQTIDRADYMYISHVRANISGDAHFPKIDSDRWEPLSYMPFYQDGKFDEYDFDIVTYGRPHS